MGATPVSHGAALPHMRLPNLDRAHLALARVRNGVRFGYAHDGGIEPPRAVFFLVSPESDPGQHLRTLAHIARRVDQDSFMPEWLRAEGEEQLRETLFRNERMLVLTLERKGSGSDLIGLKLRDVALPEGTLIAMIRRDDELVIPKGDTQLLNEDRLTVLGRPEGISALRNRYGLVGS